MANRYYVNLALRGEKKVLDEIETLFQKEIDEGQTYNHYYTMNKSVRRMGYNPDMINCRAYTESLSRVDDEKLYLNYIGAWSCKSEVIIAIRLRWPVKIDMNGVDEFGQDPLTSDPDDVGKYQLEDADYGMNPFCELPEWSSAEEALPVINKYYGTNCKTMQEAFDTIGALCHSDPMSLYEEDEEEERLVKEARIKQTED